MLSLPDENPTPPACSPVLKWLSGLVLAVSGGPDSLALMRLAARWRDRGAGPVPLHRRHRRSRPARRFGPRGAKRSANGPARWACRTTILLWRGEKPASARPGASPRGSLRVCCSPMREALGAQGVVTAHHRDDQWETVLFRLARGSGLAGLAGMARDQIFPQGRVLAPPAWPAQTGAGRLLPRAKARIFSRIRPTPIRLSSAPAGAPPRRALARTRLRPARTPQKLAERAQKADEALDHAAEESGPARKLAGKKCLRSHARLKMRRKRCWSVFSALRCTCAAGATPRRLDRLEAFAEKLSAALRMARICAPHSADAPSPSTAGEIEAAAGRPAAARPQRRRKSGASRRIS